MSDEEETVSKIQQITAQPKTIDVGGQEFTIHPLKNKEFLEFTANRNKRNQDQDQSDIVLDMITMILQKDDENITREEVEDAPMALITKTMDAMEQVNGLEDFFEKAKRQAQNQQQ